MAAAHGKNFQLLRNSVSMEEFLSDLSLSIDIDTVEVTCAGDAAKAYVEGDYGASWSYSGPLDTTNTTGADETTFGLIGGGAVSYAMMTQSGAASATNPSYTQSAILTNYTISCSVGDANRASYSAQGTGAITRAEA